MLYYCNIHEFTCKSKSILGPQLKCNVYLKHCGTTNIYYTVDCISLAKNKVKSSNHMYTALAKRLSIKLFIAILKVCGFELCTCGFELFTLFFAIHCIIPKLQTCNTMN